MFGSTEEGGIWIRNRVDRDMPPGELSRLALVLRRAMFRHLSYGRRFRQGLSLLEGRGLGNPGCGRTPRIEFEEPRPLTDRLRGTL